MAAFDSAAFSTAAFASTAFDFGSAVVVPPNNGYPLPGYNGGGGMGTAGSKYAKNFARLLDEALNVPDAIPKKKRSKREREKADEIERLLRDLPPIVEPATVRIRPIRTSARVKVAKVRGGARARVRPIYSADMSPDVAATGAALASAAPAWSVAVTPIVPAEGIQNPTDEELSQHALQLYRQHQLIANQ